MTTTAEGWQRPTPAEIRAYLDTHGLTTHSVPRLIAVHKSTVARWLTGEIEIQFAHWSALVRAVTPPEK